MLYFNADGSDGAGRELWKYDGSDFSRVVDIYSGPTGSDPRYLTVYNNELYFSADGNDGAGYELWKYNGTSASRVSNIAAGWRDSSPASLAVYNDKLFFSATDGSLGHELWMYDGANVSMVEDLYPWSESSEPNSLTEYDGALYFNAKSNDGAGRELWKYDGTMTRITDVYPGEGNGLVAGWKTMIAYNGKLYFYAGNDDPILGGAELWQYDGQDVSFAVDINPGIFASSLEHMTIFNGEIYLSAWSNTYGVELFKTNGITASLVADVYPGSEASTPSYLTEYNGELYFVATDTGDYPHQIWKYSLDSTPPVVNSIIRASSNPTSASSVDFTVSFSEAVMGVDASDFSLTTSGILTGTAIIDVSGTNATYTITVATGSGGGDLRLDVPITADITDLSDNPLSGLPYESGESYTVWYKVFLPVVTRDASSP